MKKRRVLNASDTLIECMKERGLTQARVSEMLGENRQNLNLQLNQLQDMKVGRFAAVLDVLGYQIVVEPLF